MKKILFIAIAICQLQAFAQDAETSETHPYKISQGKPTGWGAFAELTSGYTGNVDAIPVEGSQYAAKLLGSYYTENTAWVFDLGVGAQSQHFIKAGARETDMSTTNMELAARYQFENRWQLGVVYNQLFDRGVDYFSNQGDAMFGGLQVLKEFTVGQNTQFRIGLRAMQDINTDGQDINMAMLDLGIGWTPQ
ncbi:MAG: hypothetical protein ACXVAX_01930 [Pseudobdellovibrio sp.]